MTTNGRILTAALTRKSTPLTRVDAVIRVVAGRQ
jgi:hypothetical protein